MIRESLRFRREGLVPLRMRFFAVALAVSPAALGQTAARRRTADDQAR